jgi:hypothetical protein
VSMLLACLVSCCAAGVTCDEAVDVSPDEAGVARALSSLFSLAGSGQPTGQPGFTATVLEPMWIPGRAYVLDIRLQKSRSIAGLQASIASLIARTGPQIAALLGEQRLAIVVTTGLYGTPYAYYVLTPEDLAAGILPPYSGYSVDESDVVAWLKEFRKFLDEIAALEPSDAREEYIPGVGAFLSLSPDVLSSTAMRELGTCEAWMDLLLSETALSVGQILAERLREGEVLVVETLLASYASAHFVVQAAEYSDVSGWEIYVTQ